MPLATTVSFANPALDSQSVFRALLTAMASPGERVAVPVVLESGATLPASALAVLLALADHETPIWLQPELRQDDVLRFLRFGPGCPVTEDPARAAFAVARMGGGFPSLSLFSPGSALYPDESATVVVLVEEWPDAGAGEAPSPTGGRMRLEGPGIACGEDAPPRLLFVPGATPAFWREVAANHARYPLGVDLLFLSESRVAALPRSTRVEPV